MQRFPLDSYAYSLARIRWDVFGTLTFRSVPSAKRAYGRAWALMRLGAELVQRPYSQLLIALRAELGEMTGRFHFHFLLGGTQTRNEITLAHQLEHLGITHIFSTVISVFLLGPLKPLETEASGLGPFKSAGMGLSAAALPSAGVMQCSLRHIVGTCVIMTCTISFPQIAAMKDVGNAKA